MLGAMRERGATSDSRARGSSTSPVSSSRGKTRTSIGGAKRSRGAVASDNLLPALLRFNVSVSTGNFVFRRSLLEKVGGMSAFRVCHDWDFLLAATYHTPLAFVSEPLYDYRVHRGNTFSGEPLHAHLETDQVMARFFEDIEAHPAMRDPGSRQWFLGKCGTRADLLPACQSCATAEDSNAASRAFCRRIDVSATGQSISAA
jgi:hypothetical protein